MNKDTAKIIDSEISSLADSIMAETFLSRENIQVKIKTFLVSALNSIVTANLTELEGQAMNLKSEIARGKYGTTGPLHQKMMVKLGELNDKVKLENRLKHSIIDYVDLQLLKEFVKKRFGQDALNEFFALETSERLATVSDRMKMRQRELKVKSK